jgi:hypothetical protein
MCVSFVLETFYNMRTDKLLEVIYFQFSYSILGFFLQDDLPVRQTYLPPMIRHD